MPGSRCLRVGSRARAARGSVRRAGMHHSFCGRCGSPISFVGERWPAKCPSIRQFRRRRRSLRRPSRPYRRAAALEGHAVSTCAPLSSSSRLRAGRWRSILPSFQRVFGLVAEEFGLRRVGAEERQSLRSCHAARGHGPTGRTLCGRCLGSHSASASSRRWRVHRLPLFPGVESSCWASWHGAASRAPS